MARLGLVLFLFGAWTVVSAQEVPSLSSVFTITSEVSGGTVSTTAKIPHGQTLRIVCPQKPANLQPAGKTAPVQTVHITQAWYLPLPDADEECRSENAKPDLVVDCDPKKSTNCTIVGNDPSTTEGCQERRLMVAYFCDEAGPTITMLMMVNNMIDDI